MMDLISSSEFRELSGCNSMCLNASGSLGLIAGRRIFGLLRFGHENNENNDDVDDNGDIDGEGDVNGDGEAEESHPPSVSLFKKIRRQSKYEVSSLEFSPHREGLCAVASNDKVELIDFSDSRDSNSLQASIRAHTRVVTDLNWHSQQRDWLATSSIDAFIYIWDTRDVRKPRLALSSVAGASQVRWEKVGGKYLASAHEGEIKLWDVRKASSPVSYVNAHLSKIYSLDFSSLRSDYLVSSSQDSTVKLWDLSASTKQAVNVIRLAQAPVWKVRFTPFGGEGIVTLVMHTLHRGENNLMLWNLVHNANAIPEHTFYGHSDMVLEFAWRWTNKEEPQLITWSKDLSLRVWPVGPKIRNICGKLPSVQQRKKFFKVEEEIAEDITEEIAAEVREISVASSSDLSLSSSIRNEEDEENGDNDPEDMLLAAAKAAAEEEEQELNSLIASSVPKHFKNSTTNLEQEFSLLNFGSGSERLVIEKLDPEERVCIVVAATMKQYVVLKVKFPLRYPVSEVPIFSFLPRTTLDQGIKLQLLRKLKITAHQQVLKSRLCLEMCLRQFESTIEAIYQAEQEQALKNPSSYTPPPSSILGGYQDTNIPFPRTSGARFCGMGQLVCFGYAYTVVVSSGVVVSDIPQSSSGGPGQSSTLKTPRSLSAISGISTSSPFPHFGQSVAAATAGMKSRVQRVRFVGTRTNSGSKSRYKGDNSRIVDCRVGRITIYDLMAILPFNKILAEKTLVSCGKRSLFQACIYNGNCAAAVGRKDLVRTWSIAATCGRALEQFHSGRKTCKGVCSHGFPSHSLRKGNDDLPWAQHPFGRRLLEFLIHHHLIQQDIQTAASLCCMFYEEINDDDEDDDDAILTTPNIAAAVAAAVAVNDGGGSRLHSVISRKKNSKSECSNDPIDLHYLHHRSNSDTQSLEDYNRQIKQNGIVLERTVKQNFKDHLFLDPAKAELYDNVKKAYSELLLRMRLTEKSIEVRKRLMRSFPDMSTFVTLTSRKCYSCLKIIRGDNHCRSCIKTNDCALCKLPTNGLSSVCIDCGHGGHLIHLVDWFKNHKECPTGCGCICLNDM